MMVQNGYGNMWTPYQGAQSSVSDLKISQNNTASLATQSRAQERLQGELETQTQRRVESRDKAQAANASVSTNPYEQYLRTGTLSVYA
jgi:hypothetical protein